MQMPRPLDRVLTRDHCRCYRMCDPAGQSRPGYLAHRRAVGFIVYMIPRFRARVPQRFSDYVHILRRSKILPDHVQKAKMKSQEAQIFLHMGQPSIEKSPAL